VQQTFCVLDSAFGDFSSENTAVQHKKGVQAFHHLPKATKKKKRKGVLTVSFDVGDLDARRPSLRAFSFSLKNNN